MKKGFTLMEVLAVGLMLAVIMSLAAPVVRSFRFELKNAQARIALGKLAEAVRNYERDMNLSIANLTGPWSFTPADIYTALSSASPFTCPATPASTGIPQAAFASLTFSDNLEKQLFACGYLSYNDFKGLPYTFYINKPSAWPDATGYVGRYYAVAVGGEGAGAKYQPADNNSKYMYVDERRKVLDTYDDVQN